MTGTLLYAAALVCSQRVDGATQTTASLNLGIATVETRTKVFTQSEVSTQTEDLRTCRLPGVKLLACLHPALNISKIFPVTVTCI